MDSDQQKPFNKMSSVWFLLTSGIASLTGISGYLVVGRLVEKNVISLGTVLNGLAPVMVGILLCIVSVPLAVRAIEIIRRYVGGN